MAFGRKALVSSAATEIPAQRKSLVASAIRTNITDLSYNLWKFRDETWQREMWRFYDIIPEFGFAATWVGQCCSKVRIYVARVDELGRIQGEVKDPKINALADTLLGGPAAKAEHLRAMGINLTVAGEAYIVGRPGAETTGNLRDEWYILSSSEMRRVQSGNGEMQWAWRLPNGEPFTLDLENNVITRVWTPHPQRVWCADAPSHRCQAILRELEQLTKYVFSQIDSRLIGAGILIIPNDLDLPAEDGTTDASASLMMRLATAGAASMRGEGSALGVLPHIVESANAEGWKLLSFESELSKQAMDLRKEAVQRLGVGMDMPAEVLTGIGASNHWCLSVDTEIMTQDRGWVKYSDLSVGDLVRTLNPETSLAEWQPATAVNVFDVEDEPVLKIEGLNHSSISTANHRWLVERKTKNGARILEWQTSADHFSASKGIPVAVPSADLPTDPKYTDDFVKLVAAYTSDGTPTNLEPGNGRPKLHITKFQHREIVELRRVITSLLGSTGWSETVEHTGSGSTKEGVRFHLAADAAAMVMAAAPGRVKPVELSFVDNLTEAQLRLFLEAMIEIGDGVRHGKNGYMFFQVEADRLAAIERAAMLLGYSTQWSVRTHQSEGAFSHRPLHILTVNTRRVVQPFYNNTEWTRYTGKVWCPTTPNGTWLARRNGKIFYTGNSGFLIDGYGIKVHIEPLMNRICDALTKAYLNPALRLMGKDPTRYTYAFDTSPLTLRPQRLQDALNLYEKGQLSGEALRAAGYFKESEAPTTEEDVQRLAREILLRDPQLLQNESVRHAAGIPESIIPQTAMIAPTPESIGLGPAGGSITPGLIPGAINPLNPSGGSSGAPPPPAPPTGIQSELPPPIPDTLGNVGQFQPPPTGILASAAGSQAKQLEQIGITVVAEATVRRGLELAGKRLLDRDSRSHFSDVPAHELHTRIRVDDQARVNRLLAGAWDQLQGMCEFVAGDFEAAPLQRSLEKYCAQLLLTGTPHNPQQLLSHLRSDGVFNA